MYKYISAKKGGQRINLILFHTNFEADKLNLQFIRLLIWTSAFKELSNATACNNRT